MLEMDERHREILYRLLNEGKKIYKIEFLLKPESEFKGATMAKLYKQLMGKYNIFLTNPDINGDHIPEVINEYVFFVEGEYSIHELKNCLDELAEMENENIEIYFIQKLSIEDLEVYPTEETNAKEDKENEFKKDKKIPIDVDDKRDRENESIRVDVSKVINLTNLSGELITCKSQIYQAFSRLKVLLYTKEYSDVFDFLEKLILRFDRLSFDIQESINQLRLLPFKNLLRKIPRIIREVSLQEGKEIELIVRGEDTEIDKIVLEMITDPLIHLIRNCISHGIEKPEERISIGKPRKGRITINSYIEGDEVFITVEDDGRGIDINKIRDKALEKGLVSKEVVEGMTEEELINLIFVPGFSTAEKINEISGRGVGMDVVKNNIEGLNGDIKIETSKQKGTKFILRIPLTVSIIKTLEVIVDNKAYLLPMNKVNETIKIKREDIKNLVSGRIIFYKDQVIPIYFLNELLGYGIDENNQKGIYIGVLVSYKDSNIAILVEQILGELDIAVKPLDNYIGRVKGIMGASILGDGTIALVLEPEELIDRKVNNL